MSIYPRAQRAGDGTRVVRIRFPTMSVSLSQLLEYSFHIAWESSKRTGELGDAAAASRFLSDTIETKIRRGQRSRLALSNRRDQRLSTSYISSGATGTAEAACSSA